MNFDALGRVKLSHKSRAALKDASQEMRVALTHYDRHVDQVLSDPRISKESAKFLRRIWYDECFDLPLSLGNRAVREGLFQAFTITLLRAAESDPTLMFDRSRARMLSTCPDLGYHSLDDAKLNHLAVGNHLAAAMRNAKVEGFGLIDVSLIHKNEGISPDTLGLHFHAAVRSFDPKFKPKLAGERASGKKRNNDFDLKVVKITYKGKALSQSDIAGLGYYVSKISCGTKIPVKGGTDSTLKFWTLKPALRALEAYSHFEALECLRGIGSWGKGLRKACKEEFLQQLGMDRLPYGVHLDHDKLRRGWGRLYCDLGFNVMVPFEVA